MTMSLARGLSTINTKKPKQKKPTTKQLEALRIEWRQYNKRMRRNNMHSLQYDVFEDYVAYTQGNPPKRKEEKEFKPYAPIEPYVRNPKTYSSLKTSDVIPGGPTPKKEVQQYTGDLIVGIGTMHKSNLVPIMRGTNEAKDIAGMRR